MYECPMRPYNFKYRYESLRQGMQKPAYKGEDVMISGHGCII